MQHSFVFVTIKIRLNRFLEMIMNVSILIICAQREFGILKSI